MVDTIKVVEPTPGRVVRVVEKEVVRVVESAPGEVVRVVASGPAGADGGDGPRGEPGETGPAPVLFVTAQSGPTTGVQQIEVGPGQYQLNFSIDSGPDGTLVIDGGNF